MLHKIVRIYYCEGYCSTDIFAKDNEYPPTMRKGILITDKNPIKEGWIRTEHPRWSYRGESVLLCPECQKRWKNEPSERAE